MTSPMLTSLEHVIRESFETLYGLDVKLKECRNQENSENAPFEMSGIIGITGDRTAVLVLSFPIELVAKMTARMTGMDGDAEFPEEFLVDCVGESANIVAGNFLPAFAENDSDDNRLSLPSVVVGEHRVVWRKRDLPYDLMVFEADGLEFGVGFSFQDLVREREIKQARGTRRYLLVDDSRLMRMMLRKAIDQISQEACDYLEAEDGEVALSQLESLNFEVDGIFCDLSMPNLDGLGFMEVLLDRDHVKNCPVIVVTGDRSHKRVEEALERGALTCINKPFTLETVGEAMGMLP